jgi:hypothetical protein
MYKLLENFYNESFFRKKKGMQFITYKKKKI